MSSSLQNRVERALLSHGVRSTACVLGVSGGLDSMTLLHCCIDRANELGLALHVVHVNYALRGEASDADEALVHTTCEANNIPFRAIHARPHDEPSIAEHGLEATARDLRYRAFVDYAQAHAIPVVLTAHTLDDHAETVVMRIARGSGMQGLSGIPTSRVLAPGVRVVRPFRTVHKSDILAYAREHGVQWREDASNDSDTFLRNRIRHLVMPSLREAIGGHVLEGIERSTEHLRSLAAFIGEVVARAMPTVLHTEGQATIVDLEQLDGYHDAIATEILRTGLNLSFEDVQRVVALRSAEVGSIATLHGNRQVVRERDTLVAMPSESDVPAPQVVIHGDGQYVAGAQVLHVTRADVCNVELHGGPSTAYIDAASVNGRLVWRPWSHGDRFQPFGMTGHVLVSDLLTNARVPHQHRNSVRVLCDDDGIVWVCGFRQAERTRITRSTTTVYIFHYEESYPDA